MFVNVTVHRAPVAPATAGSAVIPTPDTAVGPAARVKFAFTGVVSVEVLTDSVFDPEVDLFSTSSTTTWSACPAATLFPTVRVTWFVSGIEPAHAPHSTSGSGVVSMIV